MKYIIAALALMVISLTIFLVQTERELDDCRFECNHLQTKIDRLEALSEYEVALLQLLPPSAWADLKVANAIIIREKQWEFEGQEMPLMGIDGWYEKLIELL